VLVRGINDIGSAVALRLFQAGHAVAIHAEPAPATTRRGMDFADAVFNETASVDGVTAVRVDHLKALAENLAMRVAISVLVADFNEVLSTMAPDVLVDARMRKRATVEPQRGLAPLTIGLGPNFEAGVTTDIVVETSWEQLGRIITEGRSLPLRGEPRAIAGHARDRYAYAPIGGIFQTDYKIGDHVKAGDPIGAVGSYLLTAPLDGVLRGLVRDGVPVSAGAKVIEVDPRGDPGLVRGIGERPARIADAVVTAVSTRISSASS
jgi:xanthine dehydrogenase accessory factor